MEAFFFSLRIILAVHFATAIMRAGRCCSLVVRHTNTVRKARILFSAHTERVSENEEFSPLRSHTDHIVSSTRGVNERTLCDYICNSPHIHVAAHVNFALVVDRRKNFSLSPSSALSLALLLFDDRFFSPFLKCNNDKLTMSFQQGISESLKSDRDREIFQFDN